MGLGAAWLLIGQSMSFLAVALVLSDYAVALMAIRLFQQFTRFNADLCQPQIRELAGTRAQGRCHDFRQIRESHCSRLLSCRGLHLAVLIPHIDRSARLWALPGLGWVDCAAWLMRPRCGAGAKMA